MTLETTQKVPLTFWKDGSIRLKGTRLLLDTIIGAHQRGDCPEEIFEAFPSNEYKVADIYSVLAYYLSNREKIEKYLAKRQKEADEFWKQIESDPKHQAQRKELRDRMSAFRKSRS